MEMATDEYVRVTQQFITLSEKFFAEQLKVQYCTILNYLTNPNCVVNSNQIICFVQVVCEYISQNDMKNHTISYNNNTITSL